jgi:signal transduction histidine kinase
VRIEISDEGPGVPPTDRERIWRAYQRGADPGAVAGSGIGLSVVRDVVAQHGGRAWVEDAPDRGARFVVVLPASLAVSGSAHGTSSANDPADAAPAHLRTPAPARV